MVASFLPMVTSTKGHGLTTKPMGKESTFTQRALLTKEAGSKTSSKAEAKRNGQMVLSTKATGLEANITEKVHM